MNSTVSDDILSRNELAANTATCLKEILNSNQKVTTLNRELMEINLSIAAYIGESKKRLESLKLHLANKAKSSHRVVEILADTCECNLISDNIKPEHLINLCSNLIQMLNSSTIKNMSNFKDNIPSKNSTSTNKQAKPPIDVMYEFSRQSRAIAFMNWYKNIFDNERSNLCHYIAESAILDWFGRTVKSEKKISLFLKYDVHSSKHDFTIIECIEKIQMREDELKRHSDCTQSLAIPLNDSSFEVNCKKPDVPTCRSPAWMDGCEPNDEISIENTKMLTQKSNSNDGQNKNEAFTPTGCTPERIKRKHDDELGINVKTLKPCHIESTNLDSKDTNLTNCGYGDGILEKPMKLTTKREIESMYTKPHNNDSNTASDTDRTVLIQDDRSSESIKAHQQYNELGPKKNSRIKRTLPCSTSKGVESSTDNELGETEIKKSKTYHIESMDSDYNAKQFNSNVVSPTRPKPEVSDRGDGIPDWKSEIEPGSAKRSNLDDGDTQLNTKVFVSDEELDINNEGDVVPDRKLKRRRLMFTPCLEEGQGDGVHVTENNFISLDDLKKHAVQCDCFLRFTKNKRGKDLKWDRKCRVQISYSMNPVHGDYIIWAIRYSDDTKCRRNLLAAFEDAETGMNQ